MHCAFTGCSPKANNEILGSLYRGFSELHSLCMLTKHISKKVTRRHSSLLQEARKSTSLGLSASQQQRRDLINKTHWQERTLRVHLKKTSPLKSRTVSSVVMSTFDPVLERRVLSIQSHVVHGYVGNKCCVFPLQVLGFEVDHICSVQFSNHTGYKKWKGTVTTAEQLWDLVEGLRENGLLEYTHLVTGYIGSPGLLQTIQKVIQALQAVNPGIKYICDPVLGDDGKLYLPAEMVQLYSNSLVRHASVLTPNQFEAEQLTGVPIQTEQDALQACEALQQLGPDTVVITSFRAQGVDDELLLIASTRAQQKEGSWQALKIVIPRLDAAFTGTGDLVTALLLARLEQYPDDLKTAVELATASLQGIVSSTYQESVKHIRPDDPLPKVMKMRELRLIPNQHLLVNPEIRLRAQPLLKPAARAVLG